MPGAAGRDRDLVYRIANQIFGEDVPPFSSHQWNLRVGLAALEALMLVYTLCETANLAEAATRRLHLSSLLPQAMQRRKPAVASAGMPGAYPVQTLFRHGELFRFIWAHYVRPTVAADPQASIMQRRVFPKQLRGNLNFTNSVSLKLMTEVVAVLEGTTQDFFSDVRHLPDLQAALILSVAYLLLQGGSSHQQRPLPASREELLELGPESLEKIIADLKAKSPGGNFMILTSGNKEARQSIAPLNRQAAYPPGTFADNKIYNLPALGQKTLPTSTTGLLNLLSRWQDGALRARLDRPRPTAQGHRPRTHVGPKPSQLTARVPRSARAGRAGGRKGQVGAVGQVCPGAQK